MQTGPKKKKKKYLVIVLGPVFPSTFLVIGGEIFMS
jgi:hypothetical protein